MKIIRSSNEMKKIVQLNQGDCFMYCRDYYIVTDETDSSQINRKCVNLESGYISHFGFDQTVEVVNCICTVERM